MTSPPLYTYPFLLFPRRIQANLERVRAAGVVDAQPNLWQISLGVMRMWHRLFFRFDTVGTCVAHERRGTLRARLLENRVARFPFLVAERAIAPLDFSGLASPPERIVKHLLCAHHDGHQFAYDLALLSAHTGMLEEVRRRAQRVVEDDTARARWLRDLVVYEGYHESLLAAVDKALGGTIELTADEARDPDISFAAYVRWCAAQPETPADTWHALMAGTLSFAAAPRGGAAS